MFRSPIFEAPLAALTFAALAVAAVGGASDWQDPEPPEAQALAERVLEAPCNADKVTRLQMRITTLVDRTTGIAGFGSALGPDEVPIEDRLEGLGAEITETEITIRMPGSVLFDFDSDAIRPDARPTLEEILVVLQAYGNRPARVEGHTDSIASESYNLELSKRRAQSVVDWLVSGGVDGGRLTTGGWGESRPVADNSTAEGRQQNRRVEVIIDTG